MNRRHLILMPILQHEIAKIYQVDESLITEEKLTSLCEANKHIIADNDGNEQLFMNEVVKQYGDILSSDQS